MSNLYRLTDEQVRNYRDAVTYTAAQQPTTFVARDHDKLLDALSTPVSLPAPPEEMIALWEAVERWEPVSEEYTDVWRCQVKPIDNHLQIHNEVTGDWEAVQLPPTIRLCRLVEGA